MATEKLITLANLTTYNDKLKAKMNADHGTISNSINEVKTDVDTLKTTVANDVNNLKDNYYKKTEVYSRTEVTDLHTGLESNFNEKYNSLSSEVTADKNDLKNNYYTKTQINNLHADMKKAAMTVVATKPNTGEEGIIYLVGSAAPYHMWIWETISSKGTWIDLGTSTIDLSGYAKKTDLDSYGKLDASNRWTGNNVFFGADGSAMRFRPKTGSIMYIATNGIDAYGIDIRSDGLYYIDASSAEHSIVLDRDLNDALASYVLTSHLTNTLKNYAKTSDLSNYGKLNAANTWTGTNVFSSAVTIQNELNIASNSPGIAMINVSSGNMDPTRLTKKTVGNIVATKEYVDGLAPVYATEAEINALFA